MNLTQESTQPRDRVWILEAGIARFLKDSRAQEALEMFFGGFITDADFLKRLEFLRSEIYWQLENGK